MRRCLLLTILLTGCATATDMYGPNGEQMVSINCSGAAMQMSNCYEKAAKVCPAGYRLVERNEAPGAVMVSAYAVTQAQDRSIIVQCK